MLASSPMLTASKPVSRMRLPTGRSDLDQEDAAEVERIIPDVVNETSLTKRAALRLKQILPKLG